jgi:threonine dehydratase
MPEQTPFVKVAATEAHGARVILHGETIAESETRARQLAEANALVLVHPYDDPHIIAGQGTVALEFLADVTGLDVLVVPIGGGGLISGIAVAAKAMQPEIEILGVECALYPSMWNALRGGKLPCGGVTLAEGIAVKNVGRLTLPIVRELVSDLLLVQEMHLERAVNAFLTLQKTMAEGAGAAALAAVLSEPDRFRGRRVGLVLSGGNLDPRVAAAIMMRELEREDRIVSFRISIQDRPGMLGHIASLLGALGANILEVQHRRLFLDVPAKAARLDVTVETRDRAHAETVERTLRAEGFTVQRIDTGAGGFEPL